MSVQGPVPLLPTDPWVAVGLLANNSDGSGKLTCTLSFPPAVQLLANGNGKGNRLFDGFEQPIQMQVERFDS